jgi:hypothetical protein
MNDRFDTISVISHGPTMDPQTIVDLTKSILRGRTDNVGHRADSMDAFIVHKTSGTARSMTRKGNGSQTRRLSSH